MYSCLLLLLCWNTVNFNKPKWLSITLLSIVRYIFILPLDKISGNTGFEYKSRRALSDHWLSERGEIHPGLRLQSLSWCNIHSALIVCYEALQSTGNPPSGTSSSSSSSSTSRCSSVSIGVGTGDTREVVLMISSSEISSSVRFANFTSTSVYST